MKIFRAIFFLVLAGVFVITGCAKPTQSPASSATSQPATSTSTQPTVTKTTSTTITSTGPYGNLRVAVSSFGTERFDPVKAGTTERTALLAPMFEFIFRTDGRNPTPGVAEKWEIASDGLSWVLSIRKGMKFHNGSELTADDVKFTLDRYISSDAYYSDLRGMVDHTEVIDKNTVKVYTKDKQPFMPYIVYPPVRGQGLVMPKAYFEQVGTANFEARPIGSGPYKFVRHVSGDMVEYQAFIENYRLIPAFAKLTIIKMPEETTRVAVIKTGEADITDLSIEEAQGLEASGYKAAALASEMSVVNLHGAFASQSTGKPMADMRVRQALSYAINRDEIIKIFFKGKAAYPMVPYIYPVSADIDTQYWVDYAAKLYQYDPDKAKQLLKDAGYGQGMNIKLWAFSQAAAPHLPKLAELIQSYWLKVGINAELVPTDYGTYSAIGNELKSTQIIGQAATYTTGASSIVGQRLRAGYHSLGTLALLGKAFPDVDKAIDLSMTETDPAKRKDLLAQTIKTCTDTFVQLPIAYVPNYVVLGPAVTIDFPKPVDVLVGYYLEIAKHAK